MEVLQRTESLIFTHKGVDIYMELDYETEMVTLTDKDGTAKKWLFKDRTREYLGGWLLILEAIEEAVRYADVRLREQKNARENLKERNFLNLMLAISDLDKPAKTKTQ